MLELFRYHLSGYPSQLVPYVLDQTNQELALAEKYESSSDVPWQILADLAGMAVDSDQYLHLLTKESGWLKALLLKVLKLYICVSSSQK